MVFGSILWGAIAERTSTPIALATAAGGLLVTFPFARRFHILQGPLPDHTPHQFKHPAPQLAVRQRSRLMARFASRLSTRVPMENYAEFTLAIHQLRRCAAA